MVNQVINHSENLLAHDRIWRDVFEDHEEINYVEKAIPVKVQNPERSKVVYLFVLVVGERYESIKKLSNRDSGFVFAIGEVQIEHFAEELAFNTDDFFDVLDKVAFS